MIKEADFLVPYKNRVISFKEEDSNLIENQFTELKKYTKEEKIDDRSMVLIIFYQKLDSAKFYYI